MAMKAVFGLGNPGDRYAPTRHNLGARAVMTYLAGLRNAPPPQEVGFALVYELEDHLVAFPQTYMNLSGLAVAEVVRGFSLAPADCLVVHDDASLPFGRLRLRAGGGAGGHNGLASVLDQLHTQDVPRLRLGIGDHLPPGRLVSFVLEPFSGAEQKQLPDLLIHAARAIDCFVCHDLPTAMNRFNG